MGGSEKTLPFRQVDVFATGPFLGNPVAVVFEADGLPAAWMQSVANWLNLSETVFVQRSDTADLRLRYFTPRGELPFAGHPTIGAALAVDCEGLALRSGRGRFETASGVIDVERDDAATYWIAAPSWRIAPAPVDTGELAQMLGQKQDSGLAEARPSIVDVGAKWLVCALASPRAVSGIRVDRERLERWSVSHGLTGLTIYAIAGPGEVVTRSFAPAHGVAEDPVCGTGNLGVAAHLREASPHAGTRDEWLARQGQALSRDGRVRWAWKGDRLDLGGAATAIIRGRITCPAPPAADSGAT